MALNQVGLERLNTATTKKIGTNKNLIINGAMQVAQRGTSSTTLGYVTVDRFLTGGNSLDENPTFEQADLTSSDTPYSSGFRKSAKLTNGNQTSGAEAADVLKFNQKIEAQDLATSGWNYTSASSFTNSSGYPVMLHAITNSTVGGIWTITIGGSGHSYNTQDGTGDTSDTVAVFLPNGASISISSGTFKYFAVQMRPG